MYFTNFEGSIEKRSYTYVGRVMCLKGLISATFGSFELLRLLKWACHHRNGPIMGFRTLPTRAIYRALMPNGYIGTRVDARALAQIAYIRCSHFPTFWGVQTSYMRMLTIFCPGLYNYTAVWYLNEQRVCSLQ